MERASSYADSPPQASPALRLTGKLTEIEKRAADLEKSLAVIGEFLCGNAIIGDPVKLAEVKKGFFDQELARATDIENVLASCCDWAARIRSAAGV